MYEVSVTKRYTFEAAHNLLNYDGACSNLHGHSYKLEVSFKRGIANASDLDTQGMVVDFNDMDKYVKPIVERYDHSYLNNFFEQPTAELMALSIFKELKEITENKGVRVSKIALWETEKCHVEIVEEL